MNMPSLSGWYSLQELATSIKGIGIGSSMMVKHFRSKANVGNWYPLVSTDFHEHSMNCVMVLREGYGFDFGPSNLRKHCQESGHSRDCV